MIEQYDHSKLKGNCTTEDVESLAGRLLVANVIPEYEADQMQLPLLNIAKYASGKLLSRTGTILITGVFGLEVMNTYSRNFSPSLKIPITIDEKNVAMKIRGNIRFDDTEYTTETERLIYINKNRRSLHGYTFASVDNF